MQNHTETRWLYVTSNALKELVKESKGVCLLPVGCIERHGNHLPLGTDVFIAESISYAASQSETVAVAPTFMFGDVPETYPAMPTGSFTISLETEMKLMEEVCNQIARAGFKKIVLVNAHGGNRPWIRAFLRIMETKEHPFVGIKFEAGFMTCSEVLKQIDARGKEAFPELTEEDIALLRSREEAYQCDDHAGFTETGILMHTHPFTVKTEHLGEVEGHSNHRSDPYTSVGLNLRDNGWGVDFPNQYAAEDPVDLNPRICEVIYRLDYERLASAVKFLKENDDCLKWHDECWGSHLAD